MSDTWNAASARNYIDAWCLGHSAVYTPDSVFFSDYELSFAVTIKTMEPEKHIVITRLEAGPNVIIE
jgi:hypothetical protein